MSNMLQQRTSNGMLAPGTAARGTSAPMNTAPRPTLPDVNVTSESILDAYVDFILACNPAAPVDADTETLRKAFSTPPKSDSKTFDTFTLFELIKQLEQKTLKTWAELALKLGVEPPDQEKGQSSQKIQQYAVRLKRWMHSMHIDAFFEYLLGNPHDYWTMIPTHVHSVTDVLRDGVAAEDDMALRALIPQIRPRRGRKRPGEDDGGTSPSQRPRLDSPTNGDFSAVRTHAPNAPWSAHPDGRNMFMYQQQGNNMSTPLAPAPPSGPTWANDLTQTPLTAHPMTAYPQSAITPSTRQGFWENEPRSAITPSKNLLNRRHGAKVVSSAWKSGRPGGTGKTRGRPPMNKGSNEGPFSAFPSDIPPPSFRDPMPGNGQLAPDNAPAADMIAPHTAHPIISPPPPPPRAPSRSLSTPTSAGGSRPTRPGRLSLQVPERIGGEVRLATPPPVVMVNGQPTNSTTTAAIQNDPNSVGYLLPSNPTAMGMPTPAFIAATSRAQPAASTTSSTVGDEDTINKSELEAFFIHCILNAIWTDNHGNPTPACSLPEAHAIVTSLIATLERTSVTKDAFLINLAALAGGSILMAKVSGVVIKIVEKSHGSTVYECTWKLQYGGACGTYSMRETVADKNKMPEGDEADGEGEEEDETSAEYWQKKYQDLVCLVKSKDEQMNRMKQEIIDRLSAEMQQPGNVSK